MGYATGNGGNHASTASPLAAAGTFVAGFLVGRARQRIN